MALGSGRAWTIAARWDAGVMACSASAKSDNVTKMDLGLRSSLWSLS